MGFRQAKATNEDMKTLSAVVSALDLFESETFPEDEQGESDFFDVSDPAHCQRAIKYLLTLNAQGNLGRAAGCLYVLMDPANKVVDPDLPYLDDHPERRLPNNPPSRKERPHGSDNQA